MVTLDGRIRKDFLDKDGNRQDAFLEGVAVYANENEMRGALNPYSHLYDRTYVSNYNALVAATSERNLRAKQEAIHHAQLRVMQKTFLWGLLQSNFPKGTAQDYVNARLVNPNSLLDMVNSLEIFR